MEMENNKWSVKKSTLLKRGFIVLIIVLGILAFKNNFGGVTGNTVALNENLQEVRLYMKNNQYQVEPAVLKRGIPVRMTVDANSLVGCARGVVIRDFGIRKSITPADNIIEFTPDKTGTIGIACPMNMYRGSFTIVE
ncbi:cupredoxin domain-containing protein [Candidatus Woesearchaeota archaeon]|nr:cupredoxin domain-containing protein [Candidatus Woesearchaeota archaeon]